MDSSLRLAVLNADEHCGSGEGMGYGGDVEGAGRLRGAAFAPGGAQPPGRKHDPQWAEGAYDAREGHEATVVEAPHHLYQGSFNTGSVVIHS